MIHAQEASAARRIGRNFLFLAAGVGGGRLMEFLATVQVAKVLGAEAFGKISLALALLIFFRMAADMGLGICGTREVARRPEQIPQFINDISLLRLLTATLSFLSLTVLAFGSGKPLDVKLLVILFGLSLFVMDFFDWALIGLQRMEFVAAAQLLIYSLYFSLVTFFVRGVDSLLLVPLLYLVSQFLGAGLLLAVICKHFMVWPLRIKTIAWGKYLRSSLPVGLSYVMIQVYYRIGIVLLSFMHGDHQVGLYSAGFTLVLFIVGAGALLSRAIFPVWAEAYVNSRERLAQVVAGMLRVLSLLFLPVAVAGTLRAREIVATIYGESYLEGVAAFQILIWVVVLAFVSMCYGNPLLACDREKDYLTGVSLGALMSLVLNLLLIPLYGLRGVAFAGVGAELTVLLYMRRQLGRIISFSGFSQVVRPCSAALLMGLVLIGLRSEPAPVAFLLGSAAYLGGLVALRAVGKAELMLVRQILWRQGC